MHLATCGLCAAIMIAVDTCEVALRPGAALFGDEPGFSGPADARCRDCLARVGGVHHLGCCVAYCERCDDQRLCCGCDE